MVVVTMAGTSRAADSKPVEVVPSLDLQRYAGRWFEIARYPNRFQKNCAGDTAAEYALRADGKISVKNTCRKSSGEAIVANGTAKVADAKGPKSKLKVTFFWPFYGGYWVSGLDPDYRWAIVGDGNRDYLWILSRTPRLDEPTYARILEIIRRQGFDPGRLITTKQGAADYTVVRHPTQAIPCGPQPRLRCLYAPSPPPSC